MLASQLAQSLTQFYKDNPYLISLCVWVMRSPVQEFWSILYLTEQIISWCKHQCCLDYLGA